MQYQSSAATAIAASGSHGAWMPLRSASHHSATTAMKAGSTITSRDSHEVRHISTARQARSGRPRWPKEAPRPTSSIASATISDRPSEAGRERHAGQRRQRQRDHQALRGAGEGGEEDDGEGGVHDRPPSFGWTLVAPPASSVTRRGRYWLAGWVSHSGISE